MAQRGNPRNRGATTNALPMVIMVVVLLLATLAAWMWYDMNKTNLAEKAVEAERLKHGIVPVQNPAPVETPVAPNPVPNSANVYECRRATGPIVIDGNPDDAAWKQAAVIDNFSLPWLGAKARPARTKTVARLLWDDQFLYFLAEMDDADVYADNTEHNGAIWFNDVFELFFKPSRANLGYYEFEVSANNTTFDVYFPSRGSGSVGRWKNKFQFHLETKVALRSGTTINDASDRDTGWIVEGKIPWTDFVQTGGKPIPNSEWRFALCRYDYSKDFEEPEMSTSAPLTQQNFHRYEDYGAIKFVGQ
ncbi:MAG TPA: carbohydrate-binding family 9-like protein [Planctomycetota bacterium]|nr:carbohydrate-binding family 9-like protein [Planctomycetota bacterium]